MNSKEVLNYLSVAAQGDNDDIKRAMDKLIYALEVEDPRRNILRLPYMATYIDEVNEEGTINEFSTVRTIADSFDFMVDRFSEHVDFTVVFKLQIDVLDWELTWGDSPFTFSSFFTEAVKGQRYLKDYLNTVNPNDIKTHRRYCRVGTHSVPGYSVNSADLPKLSCEFMLEYIDTKKTDDGSLTPGTHSLQKELLYKAANRERISVTCAYMLQNTRKDDEPLQSKKTDYLNQWWYK